MDDTQQKKSNSSMLIIGVVILLLVIGVGVVFASRNKTGTNIASTQTDNYQSYETTPATDMQMDEDEYAPVGSTNAGNTSQSTGDVAGAETDTNVQIINVEGGSFYYKPNEIHVKIGQPVKIVLTSKDMMHDFNVDELGVKVPITRAGQTNSVEFTPNQKGTFEFYCSVGNHRAQGQIGKLYVE